MSKALRNQRGQSITETVIFLPVLLLLFLGITYLKELTDARSRAIEAARYVTWEGVWYVRDVIRDAGGGAIKDSATLQTELEKIGLGRNLVAVRASMNTSLGDFVDKFAQSPASSSPNFPLIFKPTLAVAGLADQIPSEVTDALDLLNDVTYGLSDFVARQTNWVNESQNTIYTASVTYGFKGTGFFAAAPRINILEVSSIVSNPYNVERDDGRKQSGESDQDARFRADQTEYDDMFGPADGSLICSNGKGHIFDLWLFPTGPLGNDQLTGILSTGLTTVKCLITDIGKIVDFIPLGNLGFKIPDGTLYSTTEQAIQDP